MQELIFNVEFLSDIVLPATSNNEGKIDYLDFISGSNFLGMVAKEYNNFENSFDIFHSGKVRFGDATLLIENKPTYKVPLSFFYEKLKKEKVINQLHTPLTILTQAKQFRDGYITSDLYFTLLDYSYSQKSGYDRAKRRSKDSSMYGYRAILEGTKWQFIVKYDKSITQNDLNRIENALLGKRRLGKSKSSQYGEVYITKIDKNIKSIENIDSYSELFIYIKSRVALIDNVGNPTYDLQYLTKSLKKNNIDWSRTQIRTSTYNRYDTTRKSRDTQRLVINSGSVVVLKDITPQIVLELKKGVGLYLSEGFGELLINPNFLMQKSFNLNKYKKDSLDKKNVPIEDNMVKFLFMKQEEKNRNLYIANSVYDFIDKNRNIYSKSMNSQWGAIRSICNQSSDEFISNAIKEYISKGVAKEKWQGDRGKILIEAIDRSNAPLAFTKLLSMDMPKSKEQSDD